MIYISGSDEVMGLIFEFLLLCIIIVYRKLINCFGSGELYDRVEFFFF